MVFQEDFLDHIVSVNWGGNLDIPPDSCGGTGDFSGGLRGTIDGASWPKLSSNLFNVNNYSIINNTAGGQCSGAIYHEKGKILLIGGAFFHSREGLADQPLCYALIAGSRNGRDWFTVYKGPETNVGDVLDIKFFEYNSNLGIATAVYQDDSVPGPSIISSLQSADGVSWGPGGDQVVGDLHRPRTATIKNTKVRLTAQSNTVERLDGKKWVPTGPDLTRQFFNDANMELCTIWEDDPDKKTSRMVLVLLGPTVWRSLDGKHWVRSALPAPAAAPSNTTVACGNVRGTLYLIGNGDDQLSYICTSKDGLTWDTVLNEPAPPPFAQIAEGCSGLPLRKAGRAKPANYAVTG